MYPAVPTQDADSLRQLLGRAAEPFLVCPSASPAPLLQQLGLHYLWNDTLSGKRLSDVADPASTWMLLDMAAASDFLVSKGTCGHHGGVNVLYADGSVQWVDITRVKWTDWETPETLQAALAHDRTAK